MKQLSRRQAAEIVTSNPWTTSFTHLRHVPTKHLIRKSLYDVVVKAVPLRDRFKWWNIVPGDQIRLRGDRTNTIHEVLSINKLSNRVFLKGAVTTPDDKSGKVLATKNYHYSQCQLLIGNYEFPSVKNPLEPQVLPVFAQRLEMTKPRWNHFYRRFAWERFATKTIPIIPQLRGQKVSIPWPKPAKPNYPEAGLYDTAKEEVAKVTYKPPVFDPTLKTLVPRPPSEDEFLTVLYNPHVEPTFEDSAHVESFLAKELSNPHSRPKKLKRRRERQFRKRELLKEFVNKEVQNLNGRSIHEAKAEATFRWREHVAAERKAMRKMRWKQRGAEARLERKRARKARKELKQQQRLTQLVLREGANQVIPKDAA